MSPSSARRKLGRRFDVAELRAIKRLWIQHSLAEDARDIEGLVLTITDDGVYELVPTGQTWHGHDGVRAWYTALFEAFPDNHFDLVDIVVGPQGVFEVARLTATNSGPWGGAPAAGLPGDLEVVIPVPGGPVAPLVSGERIRFDRGDLP